MASFYAVFHGPDGLKTIASRINRFADILAAGLQAKGVSLVNSTWFDTISIKGLDVAAVNARALAAEMNLRFDADGTVGVSLDETTLRTDIDALFDVIRRWPWFRCCRVRRANREPR